VFVIGVPNLALESSSFFLPPKDNRPNLENISKDNLLLKENQYRPSSPKCRKPATEFILLPAILGEFSRKEIETEGPKASIDFLSF